MYKNEGEKEEPHIQGFVDDELIDIKREELRHKMINDPSRMINA